MHSDGRAGIGLARLAANLPAAQMGRLAREAVLRQKGALRRTLDLLIPLLAPRS